MGEAAAAAIVQRRPLPHPRARLLKRVYEHAGELTEEHGLRGFDAIHLASFLEVEAQTDGQKVELSAFGGRTKGGLDGLEAMFV